MKLLILALLFSAINLLVHAQEITKLNAKQYTPSQLKEDYDILRGTLESIYPSLYRFSDSVSISAYFDKSYESLHTAISEIDLYKAVALTCAKLNDEHVIPTPSDSYYNSLKNSAHFFPFSLKIIDRRFYVLKTFSLENKLPLGAELLSINGKSVEEILNVLLPTIPSDGYIQTFNVRHLEDYSMTQNENLFDLNYPIFVEQADSFRIEFIHPKVKSAVQVVTIPAIDLKAYKIFYNERRQYKAPLDFRFIKSNIAYLRIHSFLKWHRSDFNQDFNSLYDSIFGLLNRKGTKNLILDLRNNEGGDGTGEKLITYLLKKPYTDLDYIEEKYVGYPPSMEYLQNGKELFFIDSVVYRAKSGMYRLKKEFYHYVPLLTEQAPNKKAYKGKLYVLMNGASGSMSTVVCSFLRNENRAVFIGEESGGTMEGHTGETNANLVLPNTNIKILIPLTKKVHKVNYLKGRGVFPDYDVVPKIDDLINGIDTELNYTLNLISLKH